MYKYKLQCKTGSIMNLHKNKDSIFMKTVNDLKSFKTEPFEYQINKIEEIDTPDYCSSQSIFGCSCKNCDCFIIRSDVLIDIQINDIFILVPAKTDIID